MAIDRTWWNNLVDDDGSGTLGTPWNKATIKGLLDAIDGLFQNNVWTPRWSGSGGGSAVYSLQQGIWARADKKVYTSGHLVITSKGSLAGSLSLAGLPKPASSAFQQGNFSAGWLTGLATPMTVSGHIAANATAITLVAKPDGAPNTGLLDASQISAAVDLIFGFVYQID